MVATWGHSEGVLAQLLAKGEEASSPVQPRDRGPHSHFEELLLELKLLALKNDVGWGTKLGRS